MSYFRYDNASRAVKLGDKRFVFDVVGQLAGAWVGVLATEDPASIALLTGADGKRLGIIELTKDEYDSELKKKLVSASSTTDSDSNKIVLPRPGRQSAAVVVNRDGAQRSQTKDTSNQLPAKKVLASVEDSIVVGQASFVEPLDAVAEAVKHGKTNRKSKK